MKTNQTRFTEEARAITTALALGLGLYATAVGLGLTVDSSAAQTKDHIISSPQLSAKKTCIMLAWHQQSGGIDRARCAQYLAEWDTHRQSLAKRY
jgi:hypothetical protein